MSYRTLPAGVALQRNLAAPIGLHRTSRIIGPDVFLADRDR